MRVLPTAATRLIGLVVVLAATAACTDEKIVFRDRELFETPPPGAANFVGYSNRDTKLTACGNCHVEKQGKWVQTAHADAWAGLKSSPAAQASCEGCHSVGELGNRTTGAAGYAATKHVRYEDVQCESCHGPGLEHATDPKDETVPLASIQVTTGPATGCGECHSDTHHPFVEEWAKSRHGEGANRPQYRNRAGCDACHGGKGALEAWGVNTTYLEQNDANAAVGITCAVCHDPHGSNNDHQLRFAVDSRNVDTQLCMKCHQRRSIPDQDNPQRGPHSPQGPLLLGEIGTVGWTPPNFAYDEQRVAGTHGSEANRRLCATCHVASFTVRDAGSGNHVFSATGHLFDAIPCVDARGVPTGEKGCAMTTTARTFASCTASGCHGSQNAALSAMSVAKTRIQNLVNELNTLLARVPASEFNRNDNIYTVAEGARFNADLGEDDSSATHNPFLTEALLTASIKIVKQQYGLTSPSSVDLRDIMRDLSLGGR